MRIIGSFYLCLISEKNICNLIGGFFIGFFHQVSVDVLGCTDLLVPKSFGDGHNIYTGSIKDGELQPLADKLHIPVSELRAYSGQIIPVRAKSYEDFKRQYNQIWHYEGSDLQKEAEARIAGYKRK